MKEIWKDVKNYEGLYQVSNLGRIKSFPRNGTIKQEKILKQVLDNNGYFIVGLWKNNKSKKMCVHWIVANAFIPKKEDDEVINHIDGNKTNNCINNLERCTQRKNVKEAIRLGLQVPYNEKCVVQYDKNNNFIKEWKSISEAQRKLNIFNIGACCRKLYKTAGGYIWKFKEDI
jgi:hypothetical protein